MVERHEPPAVIVHAMDEAPTIINVGHHLREQNDAHQVARQNRQLVVGLRDVRVGDHPLVWVPAGDALPSSSSASSHCASAARASSSVKADSTQSARKRSVDLWSTLTTWPRTRLQAACRRAMSLDSVCVLR